MLINNVTAEWIKITPQIQEDKYEITLRPSLEQASDILDQLQECWESEKGTKKVPAWLGSYKEVEGENPRFVAKKPKYKTQEDGSKTLNIIPVYDRRKNKFTEIPIIANGAIINITVHPVVTEYNKKSGVTLFIGSIQLVDWEAYESGDDVFQDLDAVELSGSGIEDFQPLDYVRKA